MNETGDQGRNPAAAVVRARWGPCGAMAEMRLWGTFSKPFPNAGAAV